MSEDIYRRKAEDLLRRASQATNMKERGQLIDEAMRFHNLAMDVHDHGVEHANDEDGDSSEATG